MRRYDRLRERKGGLAIVAVRDGICGAATSRSPTGCFAGWKTILRSWRPATGAAAVARTGPRLMRPHVG